MLFSSYKDAQDYMKHKDTRPYPKGSPRATGMCWYCGAICIQYHNTRVVSYRPTHMALYSDNWHTVTTKRRMNDAIGGALYQSNWQWYVVDRVTGQHVPYFDGIQIDYEGHILNVKADDQKVLGV